MIPFVKEFENYILNENKEDSLNSLIPGSESETYLKILNQLKDVKDENSVIPPNLETEIVNFGVSYGTQKIYHLKLMKWLKEFDLKATTEKRKDEIVDEIKNHFFSYSFDHAKPINLNQNNNTKGGVNDAEKHP